MAKKIKTETEGKKAIMDVAGAKEAMAIVGKSLKAVNAEIDKLAALPTEGKAQRGMCAAMFAWGLGLKATGKAEFDKKLYDERFDDYVAKHWTDVKPAETVLRGYRSQYGAFCQASFAKFDATPMVRDCLSIANVVLPWRAARIRELLVTEGEDGLEAGHTRQLRDNPEGQRWKNDFGSGRQLQRVEQVQERHAPIRCRHGVARAHTGRKRLFEFGDVRAFDELSARADGGNRLLGVGDDACAVAGDGGQHVTAFAIIARSRRS